MDVSPFFKLMVDRGASDLFFSVGAIPHIKINHVTSPIGETRLKSQQMREMAFSVMNDEQRREFEKHFEINIIASIIGVGRFRVNIFRQRGEIAMVVRHIKGVILSLQDLLLPTKLMDLVMEKRGLIIIAGGNESGKSTTIAAMIDHRNQHHTGHILTIEDPIEYLYQHKKSIVDQREIGIDTLSYDIALKNALRESPDVVMLSEISQAGTLKSVLSFVEKGHLCLTTVYAEYFYQVFDKLVNLFHESERKQILQSLAINLKAIVTIKLIPGLQEKQVPIVEILMNTSKIADLIENGAFREIYNIMSKEADNGIQTFDHSLAALFNSGKITQEHAMRYADLKHEMSLKINKLENNPESLGDVLSLRQETDSK